MAVAAQRTATQRLRRNDPCLCGSGLRYKHCCGATLPIADPAVLAERGMIYLRRNLPDKASDCLRRVVELTPDNASAHYNLGLALELLGRDADAVAEFRTCVALDPNHATALERLGNLLIQFGRRDEATACFRRAGTQQPTSLAGRIAYANVLLAEGKEADAEAWLRETAAAFPESGEVKRLLANILREQGRFDEALPVLEAATHGTPGLAASAFYDLVVSKIVTPDDAPLMRRMRELLALDTLPEVYRARLHFALGKALDDLGEYQDAIGHFDAANRIVHRGQVFNGERFATGVRELTNVFTAQFLEKHQALGSNSELPVFIVGMPRSGTTLVEQILSAHPEVAAGGEMNFWNSRLATFETTLKDPSTGEHVGWLAEDYETVLRDVSREAKRVTNKTGSNFLWLGLIHIVFPKARIIHCRRHPVDTCLSNYFTNFGEQVSFAYDKADLLLYYRHYARLMQHWRGVFSPEYFHEIDYEQLVIDPAPATRRLIEFCGLDWNDACLRPEANPRVVKTASVWQVRQPIFRGSVGRWRHYEPWLGELGQLLQPEQAAA